MKRFVFASLGLAAVLATLVVAVGRPAEAAEPTEERGLTVTGTDSVRTVPDTAQWSFGVQVRSSNARPALRAANRRMRAVVAALVRAGVEREDIRTEAVSLYPGMDESTGEVSGYAASTTVTAVVRPIGRAGAVVEAAVDAGATEVYGPSLTRSNQDELYQQALGRAFEQARVKAERLAAKMGVTLGRPLAVVEGGGTAVEPYAGGAELARDVEVEPGRSEIGATVSVTFAIS